jgi:hypothetical protein
VLEIWNQCFNPRAEPTTKFPIRFGLLGLAHECWIDKFLSNIGDSFGKILNIDTLYKTNPYSTIKNILVEVDIKEGFPDNIEIVMGTYTHRKIINCTRIPFRCMSFHSYGHVVD